MIRTEIPATGRATLSENKVTAISLSDLEAVYGRPAVTEYGQINDYDFDDAQNPIAFATFVPHHSNGSEITQAEIDIVDAWAAQVDGDDAATIRSKITAAAVVDEAEALAEGRERQVWEVPEPTTTKRLRDVIRDLHIAQGRIVQPS